MSRTKTVRAKQNWCTRLIVLTVGILLFLSASVYACQVPVFRYALERWLADQYRITVLYEESLNESQNAVLDELKRATRSGHDFSATVELQTIDVDGNSNLSPEMRERWKARNDTTEPLILIRYPSANRVPLATPMFEAPLFEKTVAEVLDSPVRRQLAKRLSSGDSAVWIFVPCGRKADDESAFERLEMQLRADEKWLQLPSAEELEVKPETLQQVKVPLKIKFSVLTLERDDPAEVFLLESLLNSEEDLKDFQQPMAFPVFGRGRVLYALVGKGIVSETVRSASSFIAGPCSCQVKNQNPGFDLLLNFDWNESLGEVLISEPIEKVDRKANQPKLLAIPPGRSSSK